MIVGKWYDGSGLGDQLFRFITVRTIAEEKGFHWAMDKYTRFKGDFFKNLEASHPDVSLSEIPAILTGYKEWHEKDVRDANGFDIRSYDPEINFVEDNTIIDGSFEDDKYWGHNLANINKWLAVEPLDVSDATCVVGFRGGEYATQPDLFLPKEYYDLAMRIVGNKQFIVHTDDTDMASEFFNYKIPVLANPKLSHSKNLNMGINWRNMRYAKYAIIPNSAFFIIPRLLKHLEDPTAVTIAPRYWARRNTKVWARPACFYTPFLYI